MSPGDPRGPAPRPDGDPAPEGARREAPEGAEGRGPSTRPDPSTAPRGARRRRRAVVGLLLVPLLLAAGAAAWVGRQLAPPDPDATGTVVFDLEPGWDARRAAEALEAEGLVRDARVFALYLRVAGLDRGVGEGLYDLAPSLWAPEVAARLAEGGRPRTTRLVVPEGWRARDVAERLDAAGVRPFDEVMARVEAPGPLAPPWLPEGAGLEGYLFPDTYEVRLDASVDEVLGTMVEHFEVRVDEAVRARVAAAGLDLHGWTTLASLVQAEAAGPEEMPIIAGAFLNRLDQGMPLQSDPTVAYGLGKDLPELSAVEGDLRRDHPWNTYTRPALPAGPIGNPGADALEAVLAPDRTAPDGEPWLYFLHGFDGTGDPVFRPNTNLADHERDIDRFLR